MYDGNDFWFSDLAIYPVDMETESHTISMKILKNREYGKFGHIDKGRKRKEYVVYSPNYNKFDPNHKWKTVKSRYQAKKLCKKWGRGSKYIEWYGRTRSDIGYGARPTDKVWFYK